MYWKNVNIGHTFEKDADIPHRKIIKRVNISVKFRVKFQSNKILILIQRSHQVKKAVKMVLKSDI